MPSVQQARTMHTQEVGTGSKEGHTPPTQHSQPSRLSGAILSTPLPPSSPPEHPATSATTHRTASPPRGLSLETELQHLKLCLVGKTMPQKLTAALEKTKKKERHKDFQALLMLPYKCKLLDF